MDRKYLLTVWRSARILSVSSAFLARTTGECQEVFFDWRIPCWTCLSMWSISSSCSFCANCRTGQGRSSLFNWLPHYRIHFGQASGMFFSWPQGFIFREKVVELVQLIKSDLISLCNLRGIETDLCCFFCRAEISHGERRLGFFQICTNGWVLSKSCWHPCLVADVVEVVLK